MNILVYEFCEVVSRVELFRKEMNISDEFFAKMQACAGIGVEF